MRAIATRTECDTDQLENTVKVGPLVSRVPWACGLLDRDGRRPLPDVLRLRPNSCNAIGSRTHLRAMKPILLGHKLPSALRAFVTLEADCGRGWSRKMLK